MTPGDPAEPGLGSGWNPGSRLPLPADPAAPGGGLGEIGGERHRELCREARRALDGAAGRAAVVYAITGPSGVGKTTAASRIATSLLHRFTAHAYLDLQGDVPDGERPSAADVLGRLLTAGGVDASVQPDLVVRQRLWRSRTAGRGVLLVLDNATAEQARELLPGDGPSLVLVTSQGTLRGLPGAIHRELRPLTHGEAGQLVERLVPRAVIAGADPAALAGIFGALPLEIGLLAATIRDLPDAELVSLAAGLGTSSAGADIPARAVVGLAYRLLNPGSRRLLRHLSRVPGDLDWRAAAELAGLPAGEAIEQLRGLRNAGLLTEPSWRRYGMHDLFRQQIREQDGAAGDDPGEALYRLFAHYEATALAKAAPAEPALTRHTRPGSRPAAGVCDLTARREALNWFGLERPGLLWCVQHAVECRTEAATCALCGRLVTLAGALAGFLRNDGPWDTAIELHARAAAIAHARGDRIGEALARNDLGIMHRLADEPVPAIHALDRALDLFRELGDPLGQANALNELGIVANQQGAQGCPARFGDAEAALTEALAHYEKIEDRIGIANAAKNLGVTRFWLGDPDAAGQHWGKAFAEYAEIGDVLGEAEVRNHRGRLRLLRRATGDAEHEFATALELATHARSLLERARAMEGLGLCLLGSDLAAARKWLCEARDRYHAITGAEADERRVAVALSALPS
ncbi:MAG: transcriptional regulator [Actinomycetia bacterium]|nr:transcriptional regulator [Actinomycetes bacterium]